MAGSPQTAPASTTAHQGPAPSTGELLAETGGQLQDQVLDITQQVREQATQQIASQKEQLVDTLETVALLLRQAGEHAHLQDKALLAGYLDKASGQVGRWSETLGTQEPAELVAQAKRYAARQPLVFVGGALAAGFLGARFLRSSGPPAAGSPAGIAASSGSGTAHGPVDAAPSPGASSSGAEQGRPKTPSSGADRARAGQSAGEPPYASTFGGDDAMSAGSR